VVGFAAETSNVEESALKKLAVKNADMIVGNIVNIADSGFGADANGSFVVDRTGWA
jgi:phosphopantothenoylcysteine decarboxylase/phosphopantothenate--cysteine ligase